MKTVSLETAKQLKAAGFPQDTYFEWFDYYGQTSIQKHISNEFHGEDNKKYSSAPTAEEILDECKEMTDLIYWKDEDKAWIIELGMFEEKEFEDGIPLFKDESLAETVGKAYLYLSEKGLLKA